MIRISVGPLVLVAIAASASCSNVAPSSKGEPDKNGPDPLVLIPTLRDVVMVQIRTEPGFAGGPYEMKPTREAERRQVLDWLRAIDWDRSKSGDARVIDVLLLASIEVTDRDGKTQGFRVAHGMMLARDRHWSADTQKLEAILKEIRHAQK